MILFYTTITLKELEANSSICHDREKGGECCGSEYKYCGNEYIPSSMEFLILAGKYLHYSTFDDIITLCH